MLGKRFVTTLRLTDEDREVLAKLKRMTGLESATGIIRMAIREALVSRELRGEVKRARRTSG
jgi:hypothetical protein